MTLEEVRERIKRNFPQTQSDPKGQKLLTWNRETKNSVISNCGTYRIVYREDLENPGVSGISLELCATSTSAPKHLTWCMSHAEARKAAQDHARGTPLQADLA